MNRKILRAKENAAEVFIYQMNVLGIDKRRYSGFVDINK